VASSQVQCASSRRPGGQRFGEAAVVRRQLLQGTGAGDAVAVTQALVALHSTDPATVFLSVRARRPDFHPADLERQLYDERSLVRVLGMRRTLFVVPRDLVPTVYAACTDVIAARERRRLEKMILDSGIAKRPAAWLTRACKAALAAVEARGEAFTREIAADVPMLAKRLRLGAGTRFETAQSAAARVVRQLAMEAQVMRGRPRGAWTNGEYRWVPTVSWLGGPLERVEPERARAELLSKWLAAFGPATETDIRWWAGWTARDCRAALGMVPHERVDLEGQDGIVLAGDVELEATPEPEAVLLPTLDPTTMGWKERDWYLGAHGQVLFDRNGNAGPTVWWDGRVVGGWAQRADGEVVVKLLEDIGAEGVKAVETEAHELATWLGEARIRPGFLPPFQRALTA
jgi:Winged helix DNA-binding domain